MKVVNSHAVLEALSFPRLISALFTAFHRGEAYFTVPDRIHQRMSVLTPEDVAAGTQPSGRSVTDLLIMPSWQAGYYGGLKVVTVAANPHANAAVQLPTNQGTYLLIHVPTGENIAVLCGTTITQRRTAAASALAASILSRPTVCTLIIVGTGALAPHFIEAFCSVRPIDTVFIWGRGIGDDAHRSKLQNVIDKVLARANVFQADAVLKRLPSKIEMLLSASDLESRIRSDGSNAIVSCITASTDEPVVRGAWLPDGCHLDLVGSYRPDMRETDDDAIARAASNKALWVDSIFGAIHETGEVMEPLRNGTITEESICGDLFRMCALHETTKAMRATDEGRKAVTVFKSVGLGLEDLVAAVVSAQHSGIIPFQDEHMS